MCRDNPVTPGHSSDPSAPAWDLSLNYVPVPFPDYPPVLIPMRPGEVQFWRVINACADTILDIQVRRGLLFLLKFNFKITTK